LQDIYDIVTGNRLSRPHHICEQASGAENRGPYLQEVHHIHAAYSEKRIHEPSVSRPHGRNFTLYFFWLPSKSRNDDAPNSSAVAVQYRHGTLVLA
jgi:hypothetical protein